MKNLMENLKVLQADIKALTEENENLKELAYTDVKYEVYNRNFLEKIREDLVAIDCTVAFIDGNNLKVINDTLGHNAGDKHIADIIDTIKAALCLKDKKDYYIIRAGNGDEFLVIIKETTSFIMDALKKHLDDTASMGYCFKPANEPLFKYIKLADEIMYTVKKKYKENKNINKIEAYG